MTHFTKRAFAKGTLLGAALGLLGAALPVGAQAETLTVGWANVGGFAPFHLAQRMGWFDEAGLEVELVDVGNPQQTIARLMSGELDIAGGSSAPTIAAIAQGVPLQIIMGNQAIGEYPTVGLIVRADSPYQTIADLAGQTIGTLGLQGTGSMLVYRGFRAAGLPWNSAEMVNMPPTTFIENLANGNVEAVVPFAIFYQLALNNPEFRLIAEPYETMLQVPGIIYQATRPVLAERGDEIARFVEVIDRASQYANENPAEQRALDHELTRLPPAYIDNRHLTPIAVSIDTAALSALAEDMHEFGFINRVPSLDDLLWQGAPRH